MPHLPQPVRAHGFAAHRAMRRVARAVAVVTTKVARRKRARNLLTANSDTAVVETPMLAMSESSES